MEPKPYIFNLNKILFNEFISKISGIAKDVFKTGLTVLFEDEDLDEVFDRLFLGNEYPVIILFLRIPGFSAFLSVNCIGDIREKEFVKFTIRLFGSCGLGFDSGKIDGFKEINVIDDEKFQEGRENRQLDIVFTDGSDGDKELNLYKVCEYFKRFFDYLNGFSGGYKPSNNCKKCGLKTFHLNKKILPIFMDV